MVVMAPKDENELRQMLATAIAHDGPIAVRYPRGSARGVPEMTDIRTIPIGKGEVLTHGDDVLILAIGQTVGEALDAEARLSGLSVDATVVNCRFVKPLDHELIAKLSKKIGRVITVEEHMRTGGFGSAVLECLADQGVSGCRMERLGIPDRFVEPGPQDVLRAKYGTDSAAIVKAAERLLSS